MNEKKKRGLGDLMFLVGMVGVILYFYAKSKGMH